MSEDIDPLAATPDPPYWAVVFTTVRSTVDQEAYERAADHMVELAAQQPGYLGHETARDPDGAGITVSYWESLDAIALWRDQVDHLAAQRLGEVPTWALKARDRALALPYPTSSATCDWMRLEIS